MYEPNLAELHNVYGQKYAAVAQDSISSYYYGDSGNAMDSILHEINRSIVDASKKYQDIKVSCNKPVVKIVIDEDKYEICFYIGDKLLHTHFAGEIMLEALVIMQLMDESGTSTTLGQGICNWADDTNFDGLGKYSVEDTWGYLDGYEGEGSDFLESYDEECTAGFQVIDPKDPDLVFFVLDKYIEYCPDDKEGINFMKSVHGEKDAFIAKHLMNIGGDIFISFAKEDKSKEHGYDNFTITSHCTDKMISLAHNNVLLRVEATDLFCSFIKDLLSKL